MFNRFNPPALFQGYGGHGLKVQASGFTVHSSRFRVKGKRPKDKGIHH
jgi:hypothetical protein